MRLHKRTKACQFDTKTREKIKDRDGGCIFCEIGFYMDEIPHRATDIMHIVNRSQGGLGIEQNGVYGCRWHHSLLDNGNKGLRQEMLAYIENYMKRIYPEWNKDDLYYKKE